jgi:glycosyltransferase involved in cell wall biosynthesis
VRIGLDATYSIGRNLSGVGVYSREILFGLARAHPEQTFRFYYRPHRYARCFFDGIPNNASRRLLRGKAGVDLFHGLNQRIDHRAPRTVVTFHDLFVMTNDYSSPEFRRRFTDHAKRAAELSDAIIAVSGFTAAHVENLLGVNRARIHVIPHGVRVPSQIGESERQNLVLFVGAIQRRKNVGRLVKAFERMPDGWRLALAGAADGFEAGEELKAVEESPRRASIDVLGYVSAQDLDRLYRQARVFAFPSLDEGFGLPVLEAMAHGIPVVTSRTSALPEVAGDAAVLVDPQNVEELADSLLRLATQEDLRADLIRRGLARARTFTWEKAVQQTWSVYESLMGG